MSRDEEGEARPGAGMTHRLTHRGVVYPWQCDHNGHMNVMWYVGKFDEATWSLFADLGITSGYLRESQRGMVAVEQQLSYRRELYAGDTLAISSSLLTVSDKSIKFEHIMRKNDEEAIAAVTTLTGVHIDARERRSCAFPDHIRRSLASTISRADAHLAEPNDQDASATSRR